MRKKELRQRDILKLIEGLDISPTIPEAGEPEVISAEPEGVEAL